MIPGDRLIDADTYNPHNHGARCDVCPLNGCDFVPPEYRYPSDPRPFPSGPPITRPIVFVGEGPGEYEVKRRAPFIGPSGVKLNDLLSENKLSRPQISITNTLLCRAEVPGESGKKRYQLDAYFAWLNKENKRRAKAHEAQLESPLDCCTPRLHTELKAYDQLAKERGWPNGAVIMPLGNYALKATMAMIGERPTAGILSYRGSVIQQKPEV